MNNIPPGMRYTDMKGKKILNILNHYKAMAALIAVMALIMPCGVSSVSAETVSQKQAQSIAHTFFNQAAGQVMGSPKMVFNGRKLTTNRLFNPFYVYNNPAGGFVIISAENKAFPILGYSLKDNFDPNKIGPKGEALLREYARDIEYIRYDSTIPEEAIKAWNDINGYIAGVLDAEYDATDPVYEMEEADELLSNILYSGRADEYSSDMFTPAQWQEMIDSELQNKKSVALGIIRGDEILPSVVHGHKGDFYRIELDGRNQWLMRLMATEVLSSGMIASLDNPIPLPETDEEEQPFVFYDSFMAEIAETQNTRSAQLEELINPTEPRLKAIGAGRYEIEFPEEVVLARVYTLQGNMIERYTYGGTKTGHLDISAHPNGFYIAVFNGESGKYYGFKLIR